MASETRPTGSKRRRWVLDSSVWVEFYSGGPLVHVCRPYMVRESEIATPVQVLYEVYRWALRSGDDREAMEIITHLEFTQLVPADVTTTIVAVQFAADHGLAAADAVIYATARLEQAELITLDADFRGLPGVTLLEAESTAID